MPLCTQKHRINSNAGWAEIYWQCDNHSLFWLFSIYQQLSGSCIFFRSICINVSFSDANALYKYSNIVCIRNNCLWYFPSLYFCHIWRYIQHSGEMQHCRRSVVCRVIQRRRELAFLNRAYKRNGRKSARMKHWEINSYTKIYNIEIMHQRQNAAHTLCNKDLNRCAYIKY